MAYNLTPTGTPLFTTGQFGNAYDPNGGGYTSGVFGNGDQTWTLEAWVNYTGTAGTDRYVFYAGTANNNYMYLGIASNGKPLFGVGSARYDYASFAMPTGWHHMAITFVSNVARYFFDGAFLFNINGITWAGLTYPAGINIGQKSSGIGQWIGQIDEVRISKGGRYPTNGSSFTLANAPFNDDPSTIALYHFDSDGTDSHIPLIVTSESWNGVDAASWPTGWSIYGGTASIVGARGRLTNGVDGWSSGWQGSATATNNWDQRVSFQASSGSIRIGMGDNNSYFYPANGYTLLVNVTGTNVTDFTIEKHRQNVHTNAQGSGSVTIAAGANGWTVRLQRAGTTVRAKIWAAGATEPASWSITSAVTTSPLTSTAHRPLVSYAGTATTGYADFDDLTVADYPVNVNIASAVPSAMYIGSGVVSRIYQGSTLIYTAD